MSYDVNDVGKLCVRSVAQLDRIANNIANAGTSGFKADHLHYFMSENPGPKSDRTPSYKPYIVNDLSQGAIQKTGNVMDVAIQGEGYFAIQRNGGETLYTRKGDFSVSQDGRLLTSSGDEVVGDGGPIVVTNGRARINDKGVVEVSGLEVGRLRVVAFDNPKALVKKGDALFVDPGTAGMRTLDNPVVLSGHLEVSNVQATKEMIDMIDIQRNFETYQKIILTMTDMDKLSTSRVGKLA
jgi:flagellar basal-body rod protein FlgF